MSGFGKKSLFDLLESIRRCLRSPSPRQDGVPSPRSAHWEEATASDLQPDWTLASIPKAVLNKHIPAVPASISMADLALGGRTKGFITRLLSMGPVTSLAQLQKLRIGDVLWVRGCSARVLIDLLRSIGFLKGRVDVEASLRPKLNWELVRVARRIRRSRIARLLRSDDPRFGLLIRSIDSQARNARDMAEHLLDAVKTGTPITQEASQLREFWAEVVDAGRLSLESELAGFLAAVRHGRAQDMAACYLGWDGHGGVTLEAAGQEFQVSRERVRQVAARVLAAVRGRRPFAPVLDRVLSWIEGRVPDAASEIEARLHATGLTRAPFRVEGIIKAAGILGRKTDLVVVGIAGDRFVTSGPARVSVPAIVRAARRTVSRWGAATVSDLAAQAREAGSSVDEGLIGKVLMSQEDFRWLDQDSGWFWLLGVSRNALLTRVCKALAVAERLDVSELRLAVSRGRRMSGFSPPRRVLAEVCRQLPWCRLEGDSTIVADPVPSSEGVLSKSERLAVSVLRSLGGVAQGPKLEQLCLSAGMTLPTFWLVLLSSPVVLRYAPAVYGLVGWHGEPGMIDSMSPPERKRTVLLEYGWLPARRIWLAYRLSPAMVRSGVLGIPSGMRSFVEGEFALVTVDGSNVGTLVIRGSSGWGLGPFYRRRGGEPGDCLVLDLDLAAHSATIQLGDETLVDRYARLETAESQETAVLQGTPE